MLPRASRLPHTSLGRHCTQCPIPHRAPHSSGSSSALYPITTFPHQSNSRQGFSSTSGALQDDDTADTDPGQTQRVPPRLDFQKLPRGDRLPFHPNRHQPAPRSPQGQFGNGQGPKLGGTVRSFKAHNRPGQLQRASRPELKVFDHGVWETKKPPSPASPRGKMEHSGFRSLTWNQWRAANPLTSSNEIQSVSNATNTTGHETVGAPDGPIDSQDQHLARVLTTNPNLKDKLPKSDNNPDDTIQSRDPIPTRQNTNVAQTPLPGAAVERPKPSHLANPANRLPGLPAGQTAPPPSRTPSSSPTGPFRAPIPPISQMKTPATQPGMPNPGVTPLGPVKGARKAQAPLVPSKALRPQAVDYLKGGRASDTLEEALKETDLHHTTRHLGTDIDFAHLPRVKRFKDQQARVVRLNALDLTETLPKISRISMGEYRCDAFILRVGPRKQTPPRSKGPFPEHLRRRGQKAHMSIGVAVITTKATLSKRAVDRNKARRRFYEALNAVVNRGAACPDDVNGWDLVSEDLAYVAHLSPPCVNRPMEELCQEVYKCLTTLKDRAAQRATRRGSTKGVVLSYP